MHRGFLVVGAGLAFAVPAHADSTTAVSFPDPCGDNNAFVEFNGTRQDLPPTDSTPRFDLKQVTVDRTADGVSVLIQSCAPIGSPDGLKGERVFTAQLPDGCDIAIAAVDDAAPGESRSAEVRKDCYGTDPGVSVPVAGTVPGTATSTDDTRFDIALPATAITVAGDSLRIDVDRADLSGNEAVAALAPGTVWLHPQAASAEDTETTLGVGGSGDQNNFRWTAPTGLDFAGPGDPFTT